MPPIQVSPKAIGDVLRRNHDRALQATVRGIVRAAQRGKAFLIAETDRKGITDTGQYKNSFVVLRGGSGERFAIGTTATLENQHPMAGVIELGARPHPVSREGIDALTAWVQRKLAVSGPRQVKSGPIKKGARYRETAPLRGDEEARSIAFAIAAKIKKEGQVGRFVFRDAIPMLSTFLGEEIDRSIRDHARRGAP